MDERVDGVGRLVGFERVVHPSVRDVVAWRVALVTRGDPGRNPVGSCCVVAAMEVIPDGRSRRVCRNVERLD